MACYFRPDLLLEELSEQHYWSLKCTFSRKSFSSQCLPPSQFLFSMFSLVTRWKTFMKLAETLGLRIRSGMARTLLRFRPQNVIQQQIQQEMNANHFEQIHRRVTFQNAVVRVLVADPRSLFLTIVGRVLTMETYETYKVRYGDEVIKIELGHFSVVRTWA